MKIGILESDEIFVERLSEFLRKNGIEVFVFSGVRKVQTAAREMNLDMLLINAEKNCKSFSSKSIPKNCRVVFLTEKTDSVEFSEFSETVVCKYQSAQRWLAFIESSCTGRSSSFKGGLMKNLKDDTRICLFTSASGGQGTTAAALAFAAYLSAHNNEVLYFNAQTVCANCEELFYDVFQKYDIEYAQINDFYPDVFDISGERIVDALENSIHNLNVDIVVLDMNIDYSGNIALPILKSDKVILVSNGEKNSNAKLSAVLKSLPRICGVSSENISKKCVILYNKFDEDCEPLPLSEVGLGRLGGIPLFDVQNNFGELIEEINDKVPQVFEKLMEEFYV